MEKWCLPSLIAMTKNKFGEVILDENDIFDHVMRGHDILKLRDVTVADLSFVSSLESVLDHQISLDTWRQASSESMTVQEFDRQQQANWFMPAEYQHLDIAAYVLALCDTDEQLQRVGKELLMFQERDLFPMLRYLKYLVDVMRSHDMIWGVGRGSSVASYVLFLMGVHRIDSLYYDLDPGEFLR
jgi:hypothetical protein